MEQNSQLQPYLSIALTDACPFKCKYCPPHGESYGTLSARLSIEDIKEILHVARGLNIKKIRLTGGEPLSYPKFGRVLEAAAQLQFEIHVNSNGLLVPKHRELLKSTPNLHMKISLDTTNAQHFSALAGVDAMPEVMHAIDMMCEDGRMERIGTVVTTINSLDVPGLIAFCGRQNIGIKLLDMYLVPEMRAAWERLYFPLQGLHLCGQQGPRNFYTEKYGIPTSELVVSGVNVRIKDSRLGTRYHDICSGCQHWPCQEGLYCLLITPSKCVVPCRLGRQLHRAFHTSSQLADGLAAAIRLYETSIFRNEFWARRGAFLESKLQQYDS
jgi:MoaA/NifB/PqqE/SkfB family radical SAM enzyme